MVVRSGRNLAGGTPESKMKPAPIRCVQGLRARLLLRGDEVVVCAPDGHVFVVRRRRWPRVGAAMATVASGGSFPVEREVRGKGKRGGGCPGSCWGWPYRLPGRREQVREGRAPAAPVAMAVPRRRAVSRRDGSRWEVEDGPGWAVVWASPRGDR